MQYRSQRNDRNTAVIPAHAGIQQGWATGSPLDGLCQLGGGNLLSRSYSERTGVSKPRNQDATS